MKWSNFLVIMLISLSGYLANASNPNCELKAEVSIAASTVPGEKRATIVVHNGSGPFHYLFFEEKTGRMLQADKSKSSIEGLTSGAYYCIVVDGKNCSKKVEFNIP